MKNAFVKHHEVFKKLLICTNKDEYDELFTLAEDIRHYLTLEEKELADELTILFNAVQKAKNWVQDPILYKTLKKIAPNVNRNNIFI